MVSKNQKEIADKFEKNNSYSLDDAVRMVKELTYAKFDESVDLAINLNVDPRHAEENIRITMPLPNGTGKDVSILVITSGPKEKEALDAGADYVGNNEYLDKIKNGWSDVDKIVATPDMMPQLGKLGKIWENLGKSQTSTLRRPAHPQSLSPIRTICDHFQQFY